MDCGGKYQANHKHQSSQIVMTEEVFNELAKGKETDWSKPVYTLIPDSNKILRFQVATLSETAATGEPHE
jgi:hypothetical protein